MRSALALGIALLAATVLVAPGLSPVHLAYATSDSMAPTIGVDDGYVVVDTESVERGDIVTFWSAERGEYVTHRVVGETDGGYLTQGDANPSTDQAGGMAPVEPSAIRGEVLTVAGTPVVIPQLGVLAGLLSPWAMLALAGLLVGHSLVTGGRPGRDVVFPGDVLVPTFLVLAVGVALLTTAGGASAELRYRAVENPSTAAEVPVGESTTKQVGVQLVKPPFTHAIVESEGVTDEERTLGDRQARMTVSVPAQSDPGAVTGSVAVRAYPATLPPSWLRGLQSIHPWLATAGATAAGFLPLGLAGLLLVDHSTPLRRPRWRRASRNRGERP
jgi:signal peptidase